MWWGRSSWRWDDEFEVKWNEDPSEMGRLTVWGEVHGPTKNPIIGLNAFRRSVDLFGEFWLGPERMPEDNLYESDPRLNLSGEIFAGSFPTFLPGKNPSAEVALELTQTAYFSGERAQRQIDSKRLLEVDVPGAVRYVPGVRDDPEVAFPTIKLNLADRRDEHLHITLHVELAIRVEGPSSVMLETTGNDWEHQFAMQMPQWELTPF